MENIINCHAHIFTLNHVPERFIAGQRVIGPSQKSRYKFAAFLRRLLPFTDTDSLDRLATFLVNGNFASQEEVFDRLCVFYPSDTRFAIHTIDFEFMGAGKTPSDFIAQIDSVAEIKKKYPEKIYPFICLDPRRENIYDLFRKYIEERDFTGIKLYPPLGFFPFDERLYPVYEYAQRYQIPIMTHCSSSGPVYGRKLPPKDERIHPITGLKMACKNKKTFADHYTDPDNYLPLFKDFPLLKICFAHFGGDNECMKYYKCNDPEEVSDNWFVKIHNLLKHHPNTYADISYSSANFDLLALYHALLQNPNVRDKILFGSDFYMSNIARNERWFSMNVRMNLGEENYKLIAHTNAKKYLNIFNN